MEGADERTLVNGEAAALVEHARTQGGEDGQVREVRRGLELQNGSLGALPLGPLVSLPLVVVQRPRAKAGR